MNEAESTSMNFEAIEALSLAELKELRRKSKGEGKARVLPPLMPRSRDQKTPLSFAQERLWFLEQLGLVGSSYNMPFAYRLVGELDVDALQKSFKELTKRHEVLRTRFEDVSGSPAQIVDEGSEFSIRKVDLSDKEPTEREELAQEIISEEAERPFQLEKAPLFRVLLITLSPRQHMLLLNVHHIICDGWSQGVINNELTSLYDAYSSGRLPNLPNLPVQYADYAVWQREVLRERKLEELLAYWKTKLTGAPARIALPTDRPYPEVASFKGAIHNVEIPAQLCTDLEKLAARHGATPFMVMLGALGLLLSRYSGQSDLVIGSGVAGRTHAKTEGLIGFFINMLALRLDLSGNPSFSALLERAKEVTLEAYAHQDLPFEALVKELSPERNLSRQPIFHVALAMQNYAYEPMQFNGVTWTPVPIKQRTSAFDLTVYLYSKRDGLTVVMEYATDIFEESTVARMGAQLVQVLRQIAANAAIPIGHYSLVDAQNGAKLIQWRGPERSLTHLDDVVSILEQRAESFADSPAAVEGDRSISYATLNECANRAASRLVAAGVRQGERVGVHMPRGLECLVGFYGLLKAGAVYVPLDPSLPAERLAWICRDADINRVLVKRGSPAALGDAEVELIESLDPFLADDAETLSTVRVETDWGSPAYAIYTSGSSGIPKGVLLHRLGLANVLAAQRGTFRLSASDRVVQLAAHSFDASIFEFMLALGAGAALYFGSRDELRPGPDLTEWLHKRAISVMTITPSALAALPPDDLPSLRLLVVAGEEFPAELAGKWAKAREVFNAYGPTEATIWATTHGCSFDGLSGGGRLPIGTPIDNTQIYILNAAQRPVGIGELGEVYIGGSGVALGYINRPDLTSDRFVENRSMGPGRIYRTGDLGRWRADGALEFLGRTDDQIKIRGYRIEPGEVEEVLQEHAGVKQAVVIAREDKWGGKRLVAYVVGTESDHESAEDDGRSRFIAGLREHLKRRLPEYMVPSAWMILEQFPLNPSGKLDRRALPVPPDRAEELGEYVPPRTETERMIAAIWAQVLHIERISANDSFFELGGHSLLSVKVADLLRRAGWAVKVREIYRNPRLVDLARALTRELPQDVENPANLIPENCDAIVPEMVNLLDLKPEDIARIVRAVPGGAANIEDVYPLVPLQQGILFHHLLDVQSGDPYVMPTLISLSSRGELDRLIAALQGVIDRHPALRTAVLWEQLPQPVQVVYRRVALPVEELVLDQAGDPIPQLMERMKPEHQRMDLRTAPLIRLQIASDRDCGRWFALLQTHHLICDNESSEIMLSEVVSRLDGRAGDLPEVVPYRRHVAQSLAHARMHDAEAFFRSKLADVDEPTAPFGLMDVRGDGSRTCDARQMLDPILEGQVRAHARRLGVSAATLFHAGWALVMSHTSGRDDVVFGTVLLGRMQGSAGAERILGMFINTLPLRVRLQGVSVRELVQQIQHELVDLMDHEQAALAVAQRCSGIASPMPLFTALLNYRHHESSVTSNRTSSGHLKVLASGGRTNYPLVLSVDDVGDEFVLEVEADRSVEAHRILEYVRTAMRSLIQALEEAPQTNALRLSVLPESERRQVIELFNATQTEYPKEKLIQELFEEQVQRSPDAVAVVYEGQSLTYGELNAKANQLAWYLRDRGVGPDRLVGLCVDRSLEMIVALLGILKAGGAYVPLDPAYPTDRLAYMLKDAAPSVVLIQNRLRDRLPQDTAEVVALDDGWDEVASHSTSNLGSKALGLSSEHLAYIIYTSGSTGEPKGVMVEHRNVIRLFAATEKWFGFGERDVWALFHSFAFDFSVWELWGALLYGGRVVVVPYLTARSPEEFYRLICREGVTVLNQTPSAFAQLIEAQARNAEQQHALRVVIFGGEALELRTLRPWVERNGAEQPRLVNMYGITETTVHVSYRALSKEEIDWERGSVVGGPIPDLRVYVLDQLRQPVPIGVAGEIYVGGAGVARGYLNRPELTKERFLPDPFSADAQARMYKTGDLGRWRPDGTIEYLGRNDHQVKIRGFRIELGEIEAQLTRHEEVKEAVVLAREDVPGEKRLVAYVVPAVVGQGPGVEPLREHLKGALPDYMVPSAVVMLERLPLTPNGKLDRRALPAPELSAYVSRQYEAPVGEVEEILAGIWQSLLKVERVGRNDNFFELGGHSLLIVQMLERLRRVGLSAEVRRVFESPTLADLAGALVRGTVSQIEVPPNRIPPGCEEITPEMLPLVDLEPEHIERIVGTVPGGAANVQDIYPLAPLQEGMLFHHLLNRQGGDTYVLSTVLSVCSRERLEELTAALQAVINRHDILRTAVLWEQLPRPVQVVYRQARLSVEEVVLDRDRDAQEQIREWMRPTRQRLELRQAPLVRLQIAADPHTARWFALLRMHHITCDHLTTEIVLCDVMAHLRGDRQLPHSVPYREHVAQALAYARAHDAQAFFQRKLADVEASTAPFGLLDVYADGSQVEEAHEELDSSMAQRLRIQARRLNVSAATLFHAAWGLVVARTSGSENVVYGTVLLGRLQVSAGARRILGVFINTLPLRLKLQGITAKDLVEQTQRELVELLAHEQASLAEAQRCSGISGSAPLFTALLNYRHSASNPESEWTSANGILPLASHERTNYPVTLSVDDLGQGFTLTAQTDRRIDPQRMVRYLCTAVGSLVQVLEQAPQTEALTLSVLPYNEMHQVVELFNTTRTDYPKEKLIHELFEEQAKRTPEAIAVEHGAQRITYAQLNRKANQLARYLLRRGVRTDEVVGICSKRSSEMLVGILGILKAGGAYLPLDPSYPTERLQRMLEAAAPRVVLTDTESRRALPRTHSDVIGLDEASQDFAGFIGDNVPVAELGLTSQSLVYVIYTSGSTGTPKGIAMQHRSMVNLIDWHRRIFSPDDERVLQFAALSFDVAFQEIFSAFCFGHTLVLVDEWLRKDTKALNSYLISRSVQRLFVPPLMLQALAESTKAEELIPRSLRNVITAGEQLRISPDIRTLFKRLRGCRLHNHYGPTETHVVTAITLDEDPDQWPDLPVVGRPIANTRIYVLDRQKQLLPIGVTGEIYIAGAGVARGYLNQPDLTAKRFLTDPFSAESQARMYKTGDLGRWRHDGTIEYLGRNDHQVKIRGFRIELGEIEAQLTRHAEVKEAVVLAREDVPGEKRLVAYVTPQDTSVGQALTVEALREQLIAILPEYMVPSAFVMLERLPLTPNGKLDWRALPAPELSAYLSRKYEAPFGEVEEILAGTWESLLNVERVGRNDNFFELGGHSLIGLRLIASVSERLGVRPPVSLVFRYPTVETMARAIEALRVQKGTLSNREAMIFEEGAFTFSHREQ